MFDDEFRPSEDSLRRLRRRLNGNGLDRLFRRMQGASYSKAMTKHYLGSMVQDALIGTAWNCAKTSRSASGEMFTLDTSEFEATLLLALRARLAKRVTSGDPELAQQVVQECLTRMKASAVHVDGGQIALSGNRVWVKLGDWQVLFEPPSDDVGASIPDNVEDIESSDAS